MPSEREKFLRIYSDLPIKTREEVIVVVNDDPISWNVAYREIKNRTALGTEILKKLKKMDIL